MFHGLQGTCGTLKKCYLIFIVERAEGEALHRYADSVVVVRIKTSDINT